MPYRKNAYKSSLIIFYMQPLDLIDSVRAMCVCVCVYFCSRYLKMCSELYTTQNTSSLFYTSTQLKWESTATWSNSSILYKLSILKWNWVKTPSRLIIIERKKPTIFDTVVRTENLCNQIENCWYKGIVRETEWGK